MKCSSTSWVMETDPVIRWAHHWKPRLSWTLLKTMQHVGNTPSTWDGLAGISIALEAFFPLAQVSIHLLRPVTFTADTFFHFLPHPAGVNMINSHYVTR